MPTDIGAATNKGLTARTDRRLTHSSLPSGRGEIRAAPPSSSPRGCRT